MLLTLMGNLNMFGGNVPPTPIPTAVAVGYIDDKELKARELKKRLLQEDNEILVIIKTFLECQN